QPRVLAQVFRQAVFRTVHRKDGRALLSRRLVGLVLVLAHAFDAALHLADAGQILIELGLIGSADLAAETLGAVLYPVQHALIAQAAAILEKTVEGQRRVDFIRYRRV